MWTVLLVIIGCYVIAAMAVHLIEGYRNRLRETAYYILLADDEAGRMEWYLRRLEQWSRRSGRPIRVTVVGFGTDDTTAIADRFARESEAVSVVSVGERSGSSDVEDEGAAPGLKSHAYPNSRKRLRWVSGEQAGGAEWTARAEYANDRVSWRFVPPSPGQPGKAVLIDLSDPADVSQLP